MKETLSETEICCITNAFIYDSQTVIPLNIAFELSKAVAATIPIKDLCNSYRKSVTMRNIAFEECLPKCYCEY